MKRYSNQFSLIIVILFMQASTSVFAQRPASAQAPVQTPREAALIDLTGVWVSVISEDWRFRMVTPLRGDFANIPLNAEGRRVGMAWNPQQDRAFGLECKAYGAAAIMRVPGRLEISWEDDETLVIRTDAGNQTRRLHFNAPDRIDEPSSLQGYSVANWEQPIGRGDQSFTPPIFSTRVGNSPRSLEVTTRNLTGGYLRKNGAPYSEQTTVQEFFDYQVHPTGDEWFTVTTIVRDPVYLQTAYITSTDFKKQDDNMGWNPTPCLAE
jgi:hypothetical protein